MKNHYLKIIIGSILMLITARSFNFQSDKSIYLTNLENSEISKSLEFKEVQEVAVSSPVATKIEELPESFFASKEGKGQIGVSDDKPIDNPMDNIFHVNIKEKLHGNENIWLEYELKGVQDYSGISRSINDQLSVGGYLVKKSDDWVMQKELINPNDLKSGDNVIRFTIADNKDYSYQIRNLGIRIEPYSEVQAISNRRLVVNQPSNEYYYGKLGYFQGLVIGDDNEEAKVLVNGEKIRYQKGTFESLVEKPVNSNENWTVRVQAIFPDGQELYVDVPFNKPSEWDYTNGFDKEIHTTELLVSNTEPFELQLANAKLKGDSGCIDRDTKFSITALRDIDVPALDAGMVNVTAEFKGYRFLPHGTQFSENVFVELGYDTTLIPQGYTAHDIKTYFFDENSHHWVALPKDSLLLAENTIKSITYHFTDMINGIIKVPESPETQGYTPTSMKDVKAANPATGINLIAPPTANSMGSANLSYPLNIPAGRQGMQPQLAISYSSGGGNGWLGLGWNLSVPSISVDTRWGVPYFDSENESETYLMSGEQLSPVAHRDDWIPRDNSEDATKQFYPRVEGSFSKIIRHGGNPQTYWWEITDKNGIKYYYGASSTSNGIMDNAVLTDNNGNIAHWALVEVRDLNDNFIKYNYTIVEDAGVIGGTVPGYQIYLDNITYTGYGVEEGVYSVEFIRDRQEHGANFEDHKRNDVTINGRYGFKEVTADKLIKVIVSIADTVIRSYKLDYYNGAYSKTLFSKITEFDSKNNEFNSHIFSYYNNPSNALGGNEIWNTQNDYLDAGLELSGIDFEDQASVLESNINSSDGTNFIATTTFIMTSNGNGTNNKDNKNRGFVKLIDMNGDGLPDKLFRNGDNLFYRPQIKSSEVTQFGIPSPIHGDVNNFLLEEGTTDEFVFEFRSYPGGPTTGLNVSGSTSKTKTYMADVNADGFIDIVKNGVVYYNHCNQNGDIEFIPTSFGTPNQISEEGTVLESIEDAIIEKLTDLIEFNPLYDAVKYWQAPFDGTITIDAPVQLYPTSEIGGDGVYVSIQQNGAELWKDSIQAEELGIINPQNVQNLPVQKGDQFYFRVQTKDNSKGDVVSWNPEIVYTDKDDQLLDPNNKKVYLFNSAEDFLLSSENKISLPFKGSVSVKSKLNKPVLSDDIDIIIFKNKEVFSSKHLNWNEQFNDSLNWDIDVNENDTLEFLVNSESNVRWEDISWYPSLKYNYVEDDNIVIDENEVVNVVPQFSVYPNLLNVAQKYTSNFSETIKIIPYLNKLSGNYSINFTVKSYDNLLYSNELEINDSLIADTIELIVDQPTDIYFEFFSKDLDFAKQITSSGVTVINSATVKDVKAGLYSSAEEDKKIFGCLYRNWGQFVYDGSDEREYSPINEIYLVPVTEEQLNAQIDKIKEWLDNFDENGEIPTDLDMEQIFIPMAAFSETNTYKGLRSKSTISANLFTSSRLRPESVTQTPEGINKRAITKFNKSLIETMHGGVDLVITNPDLSKSRGFSKTFSNFMDINGDRYPDIVTSELIQFSNQNGDLSDRISLVDEEYLNFTTLKSEGESIGVSISGNSSQIKQACNSSSKSSFSLGISFGISGSVGEGSNNQTYSWFDINGDGLPDKLYGNGMVALNFGYSFGEPELWNFTDIRKEESTSKNGSVSGGLSAGFKYFSIGGTAGAGISRSDNSVSRQFNDINNDGLTDIVLISDNKISVKYNTGNGFTTERNWITGLDLGKSVTVSEYDNYGGSFSVGIGMFQETISELEVSIDGIHRLETSIEDVDGDGFADYLQSNSDDKLVVRRSNIVKTNLLKAVQRPLNATIVLDYETAGNTFDMPNARQVLSSVTVNDGHNGDGADKILTRFEYSNGKYDRHEREFYGFKTVKTNQLDTENNDAVYRTIVKEFANDSYYIKGLLLSETIQNANENKFIETVNKYSLKNRTTMQDLPDDFEGQGINIALPLLVETIKHFYEGNQQAQKSTRITFAYGDYGNVVAYTDFADMETTEDNISSTIDYWEIADKNVLNIPKSIVVTGGDGNTYRKRETSIDDDGRITQIRQYLKAGQPATFDLFYNDYGNLDSVIRPANYNGDRMYFAYDYDNVVHSYITNVRDAYGYSSSSTNEYRFGQVVSTTDINGQKTLYEIDDLGRITKITGPYELDSGQDYTIRFAYHPDATTPWAHTQHYDPAHPENPIETALFIDGLGRVLQTKKDGAVFDTTDVKDIEVMLVSGKVIYDAFGRSVESYYPVSENKGRIGTFNKNVDGETPTKVTYDILDRTKTTILPDIATTTFTYGFGDDRLGNLQFMTTVEDAEMKETTSYTDIKGLQTAIKAPGDVWTSFVYNSINELKEVTDAENNITVSEYDMFGRRVSRDHPDAGLTEYTYDISGNMLTQTTANLRKENMEMTYEYDYSRLTNINYPENPENNVIFQYGEPGADYNRAGRIVVQEDATGAQEFFYGNLGEITKNLRTIIVPDDGIYTFVTVWQYDTWNRLTSMKYPDGEELTYEYNTGGLLHSMFGKKNGHRYNYLNQLGYDKFEDRVYLAYGNGTETTYDYEPKRRRLQNITATTSAGRQMMNNTYAYDNVNNIVNLKNEAPIPTDGLKGGSSEYNYVYDDLYRLDYAEGTWQGESHEHRYTMDMDYSPTGSIERKNQSHDRKDYDPASAWVEQNKTTYDLDYKYDGAKPHAPSQIGELTYTYDANGNQIGWQDTTRNQHREILWDQENRIRAIADNGLVNHYIYDASGERVIKSNGDGQVVKVNGFPMGGKGTTGNYSMYVNPFMVVNSMKFTKHFYIEGQRIVSKLGDMGKNQELLNPKDTTRAGNNGNHPIDWDNKNESLKNQLIANFEELGLTGAVFAAGKSGKVPYGQIKKYFRDPNSIFNGGGNDSTNNNNNNSSSGNKAELLQFYYHPDHLGSSNYITNVSGEVYQHMEYFPFGETFIEERTGTEYTNYLYNGKEFDEEIGLYYYGARYYDPKISMWYGVDPLVEKNISKSPYNFVSNNPLTRIDPDGKSDYTVNKKTGETKLIKENDQPDRILKTYSRKSKKGEVKYRKNGEAKVAVKDIKQGFLKDGMNLKTENYVFGVEGTDQPTVTDFEDFAFKISNYVDKEVGGYYLSKNDETKTSFVYLNGYKSSTDQNASAGFNLQSTRPDLIGKVKTHTSYHTHLSRFDDGSRLVPSSHGLRKGDVGFKERTLKLNSQMKFIIITNPKTFPY